MDVKEQIVAKRQELLERRRRLMECWNGIRDQLAEVNQSISDCSAAARVLGIELEPLKNERAEIESGNLRQFIRLKLEEAGPVGIKARDVRPLASKAFGKEFHEKTIGMTLYRLKSDGLARRQGHVWWWVGAPVGEATHQERDAT